MKSRFFLKICGSGITAALCLTACAVPETSGQSGAPPVPSRLTAGQLQRVGQRIWQNECGGTVAGLTSWNTGEDFASLGIGHFIWYPAGKRGPFEESFPPLLAHLQRSGVALPEWLRQAGPCPWSSRTAFLADAKGARQQELRTLLSQTVAQQTDFIAARMRAALPKMLSAAPASQRAQVQNGFNALQATPEGTFCLIDYVNFKGEGVSPTEQYNGQGWGLLQVLAGMTTDRSAPAAFAESAKRVLTNRVRNAPPARGENRWLPGWLNRCEAYKRPL
jgi:hypothetical protein